MVPIGGKPILWHIMNHYSGYGHNEFAVALGDKGEDIKKYFVDYAALVGSLHVDMKTAEVRRDDTETPDWRVNLVETGVDTLTGGRIKRLQPVIGD